MRRAVKRGRSTHRETAEAEPAPPASPDAILGLQRDAGNAAVARMLTERRRRIARVKTNGGDFQALKYEPYSESGRVGARIQLEFDPFDDLKAVASQVGMVQVNQRLVGGKPDYREKLEQERSTGEGWGVDMDSKGFASDFPPANTNPVYQSEFNRGPGTEGEEDAGRISQSLSDVGVTGDPFEEQSNEGRGLVWSNEEPQRPASLFDTPALPYQGMPITDRFETSALILDDAWKGPRFLGSIRWGWKTDGPRPMLDPNTIELASPGDPTQSFVAAAKKWNAQENLKDGEGKALKPVQIPL
jgi:hypothetical protein